MAPCTDPGVVSEVGLSVCVAALLASFALLYSIVWVSIHCNAEGGQVLRHVLHGVCGSSSGFGRRSVHPETHLGGQDLRDLGEAAESVGLAGEVHTPKLSEGSRHPDVN